MSLKRNSERDEQKEELPFRKTDLEHLCLQLKTIFQVTAEKEGGLSTRNYRKWFDENDTEIQKLFQAKRSCHIALLSSPLLTKVLPMQCTARPRLRSTATHSFRWKSLPMSRSVISNDATMTKEVDDRVAKASSSFGRFQHSRVWHNHSRRLLNKVRVYLAFVISSVLHAPET